MPNVDANLIELVRSPDYDPNRVLQRPVAAPGMHLAFRYNADLTDPVLNF